MQFPTRIVGNAAALGKLRVSTGPVKLVGFVGHNYSDGDLYVQAHQKATDLVDGDVPIFSIRAFAQSDFSFALPCPVELDSLIITKSTLANGPHSYAASVGTQLQIQALVCA